MNPRDSAGLPMTGATAEGLAHFETATHQFRCYIGDPVASVDAALAAAPQMVLGHALKAYLHLLGTEPLALSVARDCLGATASAYSRGPRSGSPMKKGAANATPSFVTLQPGSGSAIGRPGP